MSCSKQASKLPAVFPSNEPPTTAPQTELSARDTRAYRSCRGRTAWQVSARSPRVPTTTAWNILRRVFGAEQAERAVLLCNGFLVILGEGWSSSRISTLWIPRNLTMAHGVVWTFSRRSLSVGRLL